MIKFRSGLRDYTVTISGPERDMGEAPYTYVLRAKDMSAARRAAMERHIEDEGFREDFAIGEWSSDFGYIPVGRDGHPIFRVVEDDGHTFEGVPGRGCRYHWNDLRHEDGSWLSRLLKTVAAWDISSRWRR